MTGKWNHRALLALWVALVAILGMTAIWGMACRHRASILAKVRGDVPSAVLDAALRKDWRTVDAGLKAVTPATASPTQRMLKAHACLELNATNEATRLFASMDAPNVALWAAWTRRVAVALPSEPVAMYLLGDAYARSGHWKEAVQAYTHALDRDPNWAAALQARGVTQAASGAFDPAILDLKKATDTAPQFADAFVSRGTLCIQQRVGPEGAITAFECALKICPDDMLAQNGRGAVRIVTGDLEGAKTDLLSALHLADGIPPIEQCVKQNLRRLVRVRETALHTALARLADVKPGTDINLTLSKITNPKTAAQAKAILNNAITFNRDIHGIIPDAFTLKGELSRKPAVSATAKWNPSQHLDDNLTWQEHAQQGLDKKFPGVKPTAMSPTDSFLASRKGVDYELTHPNPGGFSSKGIEDAPIESGRWGVVTIYGLGYATAGTASDAEEALTAAAPQRKEAKQ